jgi:hypothetical protein
MLINVDVKLKATDAQINIFNLDIKYLYSMYLAFDK